MEEREYEVGDHVLIVNPGACPWGYDSLMVSRKNSIVTITEKRYDLFMRCFRYKTREDGERYVWSGNCFGNIQMPDLPSFAPPDELAISDLLFRK